MTGKSTDSLVETLYCELREMAAAKMRGERAGHSLQTTALVHEVYLKLNQERLSEGWSSQSHFLRAAADAMRRILVDQARKRLSLKRGGDKNRQDLPEFPIALPMPVEDLLAIHDCLDKFAEEDPVKAELVKLRVFAGLNHAEAAEALQLPKSTADRYWAFAKARLMALMSDE
ncbi:MAG: ECF-type sigma factor [Candidatus Paceibacterota bacterium]